MSRPENLTRQFSKIIHCFVRTSTPFQFKLCEFKSSGNKEKKALSLVVFLAKAYLESISWGTFKNIKVVSITHNVSINTSFLRISDGGILVSKL